MLEAVKLGCERGDRLLFSDLSFQLVEGGLLRLSGVNGSGKTSLLRILCGLLAPLTGVVRWRDDDIRGLDTYASEIIYIGHLNAVADELTATENLAATAAIGGHPISRNEARKALQALGLLNYCDWPAAKSLSQGQKRRVALARLAVSRTQLWLLDEPFNALDDAAVKRVQDLIDTHLAGGGLVVLVSHQHVALKAATEIRIDL